VEVKLLDHTKLSNAVIAGRTAWNSFKPGKGYYEEATNDITKTDTEFLQRLVLKYKHESVVEQITYVLSIKEVSRAFLQQWSRSRHISQTVKSTRYNKPKEMALKALDDPELTKYVEKYFKGLVERFSYLSIDEIKYAYPEAVLTDLVVQMNARELRHLFELRTKRSAMKEYRNVMHAIYDVLPEQHKFLYKDVYTKEE